MVHKRKIIVRIAASADGFIARPHGSADWLDRPRVKGKNGTPASLRRFSMKERSTSSSSIPIFIGEGIPLVAPGRRAVPLKLLSRSKFTDGVVKLHYACRK